MEAPKHISSASNTPQNQDEIKKIYYDSYVAIAEIVMHTLIEFIALSTIIIYTPVLRKDFFHTAITSGLCLAKIPLYLPQIYDAVKVRKITHSILTDAKNPIRTKTPQQKDSASILYPIIFAGVMSILLRDKVLVSPLNRFTTTGSVLAIELVLFYFRYSNRNDINQIIQRIDMFRGKNRPSAKQKQNN